jgi:hypothetical protein
MDWDTVISILKWIGLAFTAGLVGYFGKFLGQRIISHFSEKKENAKRIEPPVQSPLPNEKRDYKLEKKRLKQEIKRKKKQEKTKK